MWSLCWEIGSTVPIKKSVANLSKLSLMLVCSKPVSFQNYLFSRPALSIFQHYYHLWTSIFQQNSQHLIQTLRQPTSQTLLLLPWGPDATWTNVNYFHLISRSPLCHIKSQIVSSFTCLLTQSAQNNRPQCLQWWRRFVTEKEAWNRSWNMIHDAMIWNKMHDLVQLCFW